LAGKDQQKTNQPNDLAAKVLRILEQAAGHLHWKSVIHPRNLWVRGLNLTGGSQPA